jgi:hypothetical protein
MTNCANAQKGENKMRYGRRNRYPGNGPFSDLPPYQRPGFIYGGGRGYWGTDPSQCARFPWLPRWWWASPDSENVPAGAVPTPQARSSEREFLETQLKYLNEEIEQIRKRLEDIGKTDTD